MSALSLVYAGKWGDDCTMTRAPRSSTVESAAARYLAERRGRAAFRGAPSVARAAAKILKPLANRFGPGVDTLSEHWADIVGEKVAAWSAPEAIRGGVLHIIAKGPAAAIVEAQAPRILERVANFAGDRAPNRLRVRQGTPHTSTQHRKPVEREITGKMHETLVTPGADRLSSALDRFDRAVRNKRISEE